MSHGIGNGRGSPDSCDQVRELFDRLKSADMNLILAAQNRSVGEIGKCLRARRRSLEELAVMSAAGVLSRRGGAQVAELARWQGEVETRNKRIAALLSGFYNETKQEFLASRAGKAPMRPYLRSAPTHRRVTI